MSDFDPAEFLAAKTPAPAAAPASTVGFDPVAFLSPGVSPRQTRAFYGPGSVDPDEKPITELGKVRGFGNFALHPKISTDSEHDAAMRKAAADSHLDDPGVQAIVGGVLGAGAGELVSSGLGAVAPKTITNIAAKGVEGGVQSKAQGGSFTQGALLGGGTAALPALGRVTASAGRSIGESSIARSEERALTSQAPVQDAIKKAAAEIKASATKTAQHAVLAELAGGGHSMLGHGVAGLSAAYNIGRPIAQAAGTAADEGIAAIARRVLGEKAEDTNPFRSELWSPRKNTPLPPSWSPRAGMTEEAPGIPDMPAAPADPKIAQLQDALKTATPEQAEMINASIAGLMKRGAAPVAKAVRPPIVQLAPSLDERAAAAMGPIPELPSVHADARTAAIKSAKDALLSTHVPEPGVSGELDAEQAANLRSWRDGSYWKNHEARENIPRMSGDLRSKALAELSKATETRITPGGQREFRLYRGTPTDNESSFSTSWTPKRDVAEYAANNNNGMGIRAGRAPGKVIDRWINEEDIKSIPKHWNVAGPDDPWDGVMMGKKEGARPSVWDDHDYEVIVRANGEHAASTAPAPSITFEPSKFDDKFARKLKMSVDDYRAMMQERLVTAQKVMASPHATMAEKLRAAQLLRGRTNVPLPGEDDAGRPLEPDQPTMN